MDCICVFYMTEISVFLCFIIKPKDDVISSGRTYRRQFIHYDAGDMNGLKLLRSGSTPLTSQSRDMQFFEEQSK